MPDYPISEKQFAFFKRSVFEFVREFGLTEYDVAVKLEPPQNCNAMAHTEWSIGGRWSVITLAPIWKEPVTARLLKLTAFHEATHLLLAPILHEAYCRYTAKDTIEEIEEGVVVRLENFYRRVVCKENP